MTPWDYGMTRECELIGGPVDGLKIVVTCTVGKLSIPSYARDTVGVKDCGVSRRVDPTYNRIDDRRFQFVGYR